jgi:hypothetical protein
MNYFNVRLAVRRGTGARPHLPFFTAWIRATRCAEGIKGWQQLAKLRELGCHLGQGHSVLEAGPG